MKRPFARCFYAPQLSALAIPPPQDHSNCTRTKHLPSNWQTSQLLKHEEKKTRFKEQIRKIKLRITSKKRKSSRRLQRCKEERSKCHEGRRVHVDPQSSIELYHHALQRKSNHPRKPRTHSSRYAKSEHDHLWTRKAQLSNSKMKQTKTEFLKGNWAPSPQAKLEREHTLQIEEDPGQRGFKCYAKLQKPWSHETQFDQLTQNSHSRPITMTIEKSKPTNGLERAKKSRQDESGRSDLGGIQSSISQSQHS